MLLLLGDDDADSSEDGGGGALLRISAVLALGKAVCRTSKVWIAPSMSSTYIHVQWLTPRVHLFLFLRSELFWEWELQLCRWRLVCSRFHIRNAIAKRQKSCSHACYNLLAAHPLTLTHVTHSNQTAGFGLLSPFANACMQELVDLFAILNSMTVLRLNMDNL